MSLPDCLKRKDLSIFALKTYPVSWGLTREKLLQKSLKRFLNWGIAWNGVCITAPITFPKSEKEFTLQDVLESTVPEKYRLYGNEPWHSRGLRVMPVDNYLVFYIPDKDTGIVTVIRVMYEGRNVENQLNNHTVI